MRTPLLLVFLLAALLVASCEDRATSSAPATIPSTWWSARTSPGHVTHVRKHSLACTECHANVGAKFDVPSIDTCQRCHADHTTVSHARDSSDASALVSPGRRCFGCHVFNEDPLGSESGLPDRTPWDCLRCHAHEQGRVPPVERHRSEACSTCHQPHADEPVHAAECVECHTNMKSAHPTETSGQNGTMAESCLACHGRHTAARLARTTCVPCHEARQPAIGDAALSGDAHPECITCHVGHDFDRASVKSCEDCHESRLTVGGPKHAECTSCHTPHSTTEAVACGACHSKVKPDHPPTGDHAPCTGCHAPHPKDPKHQTRVPCSSCHDAESEGAWHAAGIECAACHDGHSVRPDAAATRCESCHTKAVRSNREHPEHGACTNCHQGAPHDPKAGAAPCAGCHEDQAGPPGAPHRDCSACHEPHTTRPTSRCKDCHTKEHAAAPVGHRDCRSCHEPHQGAPRERATCVSCHTLQLGARHAKLDGGCVACHAPHTKARSAATCGTCHDLAKLPGQHAAAQHQRCTDCHDAHEPAESVSGRPTGTRATCLSCHTDQRNHQPKAERCTGCHMFTQAE